MIIIIMVRILLSLISLSCQVIDAAPHDDFVVVVVLSWRGASHLLGRV